MPVGCGLGNPQSQTSIPVSYSLTHRLGEGGHFSPLFWKSKIIALHLKSTVFSIIGGNEAHYRNSAVNQKVATLRRPTLLSQLSPTLTAVSSSFFELVVNFHAQFFLH
jgi:hypothetical protein